MRILLERERAEERRGGRRPLAFNRRIRRGGRREGGGERKFGRWGMRAGGIGGKMGGKRVSK